MALVNQFQTKFENAVTLYGTVANDIRKLARSVNISSQLNEFSNVLATLRNRNPQMLQEINLNLKRVRTWSWQNPSPRKTSTWPRTC